MLLCTKTNLNKDQLLYKRPTHPKTQESNRTEFAYCTSYHLNLWIHERGAISDFVYEFIGYDKNMFFTFCIENWD